MRIIAGSYKGRIIHEAHGHRTHPMSEKIRGALFNALGDIEGLHVLDAFTGTGAVAIEALSRGAAHVAAIDEDKEAFRCATKNCKALSLEKRMQVTQANVSSWSERNPSLLFDIVIADPPYDDVQGDILQKLVRHIKSGGLYILSLPTDFEDIALEGCTRIAEKQYGDASLHFYRCL